MMLRNFFWLLIIIIFRMDRSKIVLVSDYLEDFFMPINLLILDD